VRLQLISVGSKEPGWVSVALQDYVKRLPADWALTIREIPLARRRKNSSITAAKDDEAKRLLKCFQGNDYVIALDARGKQYDSKEFSAKLAKLRGEKFDISFLVGGPDGLSQAILDHANEIWSLSKLTFPHQLARLVLIEQIYRSWAILSRHPYHK